MGIFKSFDQSRRQEQTIKDLYRQIEYLNKKLTESNKRISNLEQDLAVEQAIKYINSHDINSLRKNNPCLKCQLKDSCISYMKDRCVDYQVFCLSKQTYTE